MINTNFSEAVDISLQFSVYDSKNDELEIVTRTIDYWTSFTVTDNYTGIYKEATINFNNPDIIEMFTSVSTGSKIIIAIKPNQTTGENDKELNNTTIFIGYVISKTQSMSINGNTLVVKCKDFMYKLETSTISKTVKFTDEDTVQTLFDKLIAPVLGEFGEGVYLNINDTVRNELLFNPNLITKKVSLKRKNINIANYQPKIGTSVYDSFIKILHLHNLHMTSFFKDDNCYIRIAEPVNIKLVMIIEENELKVKEQNTINRTQTPINRNTSFYIGDVYLSLSKTVNIEKQIPILIAIASSNSNADVKGSNLKSVMLNEFTAYNHRSSFDPLKCNIKDNINQLLQSPQYNFKNPKNAVPDINSILLTYQKEFEDDKRVSIFNVGNAYNQEYLDHYVLMSMRERQQEAIKVNVTIPGFGCVYGTDSQPYKYYAIPASDCIVYIKEYHDVFYIKSVTYNCSMSGSTTTLECILPNTMQFAKV